MLSLFSFGQELKPLGFTALKIDGAITYKEYKNRKFDSIIVGIFAVNYGNGLFFPRTIDSIIITNAGDQYFGHQIELRNKKQIQSLYYRTKPLIVFIS